MGTRYPYDSGSCVPILPNLVEHASRVDGWLAFARRRPSPPALNVRRESMPKLTFNLFGSFQRGVHLEAENPVGEVWKQLELAGTTEQLARASHSTPNPQWAKHCEYASFRIRQAKELRDASVTTSPLTRPILLYYSMLNLLRAIMALGPEKIPSPAHGLKYVAASDLFDCGAKAASGTFSEYLDAIGHSAPAGLMSLRDCLRQIIELAEDVASTTQGPTRVAAAVVKARSDGEVLLEFAKASLPAVNFKASWRQMFPGLASVCSDHPQEYVVRVSSDLGSSEGLDLRVSEFLEAHALPDLRQLSHARWFLIREEAGQTILPRAAAYLVTLFILSNVCRYDPERLGGVLTFSSEAEWLLRQALAAADRYFPQLMLCWGAGRPVFV